MLKKKKESKQKTPKSINRVKNWYQDRYESVLIQRNVLFILVIALVAVFSFTILEVIDLNSKKVYEPFIVQIEENTGVITKVNSSDVRKLSGEKALRDSSLVKYITAREGYNYADFSYNYYQVVRLMSNNEVYRAFQGRISPGNPNSPISLGQNYRVDVNIKTIVDLNPKQNLVQIRISTAKVDDMRNVGQKFEKRNSV